MPSRVAFHFAIANTDVTSPDEVLDFIEQETNNVETYRVIPRFGSVHADAFNYVMVLGVVGSAASIASLLWQAYDQFIASKKDVKSNAGIVINVITPTPGTPMFFWIGGTYEDREQFIADFTNKVTQVQEMPAESEYNRAVDEIMKTDQWIPRRGFNDNC